MKITCNVVRDLLNQYADGALSDDSKRLVEEHIDGCCECSKRLTDIREICAELDAEKAGESGVTESGKGDYQDLVGFKRWVTMGKIRIAAISFVAAIVICVAGYQITHSNISYVPYDKSGIYFDESGILFTENACGFTDLMYRGEDRSGEQIAVMCLETTFAESHWGKGSSEPDTEFTKADKAYNQDRRSWETYPSVDKVYYCSKDGYVSYDPGSPNHIESVDNPDYREELFGNLDKLLSDSKLVWERSGAE